MHHPQVHVGRDIHQARILFIEVTPPTVSRMRSRVNDRVKNRLKDRMKNRMKDQVKNRVKDQVKNRV